MINPKPMNGLKWMPADSDAAKGLAAALKKAKFKVKRVGKVGLVVEGFYITEATIVPTNNKDNGFYGTVKKDKDAAWRKQFVALTKIFKSVAIIHVRNFLDSTYGRHLADEVNSGYSADEAIKNYFPTDSPLKKAMEKIVKDVEAYD